MTGGRNLAVDATRAVVSLVAGSVLRWLKCGRWVRRCGVFCADSGCRLKAIEEGTVAGSDVRLGGGEAAELAELLLLLGD